jgi:hypothetical protein
LAEQQDQGVYEAEVERVRAYLAAEGRSRALLHLFEYLVVHSRDIRAPKEIEIAFEVFKKDHRFDTSQDSMVRVYMHRLRGRLDEVYESVQGGRLVIPKGEYRIVLVEAAVAPSFPAVETSTRMAATSPPAKNVRSVGLLSGISRKKLVLALAVLTPMVWTTMFYLRHRSVAQSAPVAGAYRNGERRCGVATLVTGDTYLYFRDSASDDSRKLIMRPAVTSPAQLDAIRVSEAAKGARVIDLDDYYMSADNVGGLWSLLTSFSIGDRRALIAPAVLPNSKLTPDALNRGDIIYYGRLDQLGSLHDNVFQSSRFALDPMSDTLRDVSADQNYTARMPTGATDRDRDPSKRATFASDYGYLARIAKPNGCAIWIVAGLQDAALPPMARIVGDPALLRDVYRQSKSSRSFEALYEFRSVGALRYTSRLILARPIRP